ncbi:PREDICTED: c-C motif chemokine 15 [Chrysochloris asiatica]|uniref:C-C motif chemokine n=1 Tax=Chrysochloris asiatica TaxID=185453 RepID=A0A9B0WFA1_CHRAS|nr:PREDICTED: c-C motif chemokine 15 [Chrysochloris asiatica]
MKVSVAILSFLILAVDLGSQVQIKDGFYHPVECCYSYITRNIPCAFMTEYFDTSSWCPRPGIIFLTKRGKQICVDPNSRHFQYCMERLTP